MHGIKPDTTAPPRFVADLWQVAVPILFAAGISERMYHIHRFGLGAVLGTYWGPKAEQIRALDPTIAAGWPFSGDAIEGFLGPLIDPQRSVFLTEPLLLLLGAVLVTRWRHLNEVVRSLVLAIGVSFGIYLVLHAKLVFWSGAWAWGARYHTAPVQMLAMLSIPLALKQRDRWMVILRRIAIPLAVAWQLCAVAIDYSVEEMQAMCAHESIPLVPARLHNLSGVLRGNGLPPMPRCELAYHPDWNHLTFLPFRNAAELPPNFREVITVAWAVLAMGTAWIALVMASRLGFSEGQGWQRPGATGATIGRHS